MAQIEQRAASDPVGENCEGLSHYLQAPKVKAYRFGQLISEAELEMYIFGVCVGRQERRIVPRGTEHITAVTKSYPYLPGI